MAVRIKKVIVGSPAAIAGIKAGEMLISIDGMPINDVLDYMYYADDDMGLEFDTFLMDKKRHCGNKCVFCFIDQLPPKSKHKLRETLYFKDDDSRLSFLQGNYITLTNLTEQDIDRIIEMRTPVNVSVHTTNPELRAKMMGNKKAGESLSALYRFARAGITMNCQLVLCPGINDGAELVRTLDDLKELGPSIESVACVPVGLTKFRENLPQLRLFSKTEAADVIKTISGYECVYAADEFYLTAEKELPPYEHYGAFSQYENGVGMWAHLKRGFADAKARSRPCNEKHDRKITVVTGVAAFQLIKELTEPFENVNVIAIRNDFFGNNVTVSGLLTGTDIIRQLLLRKDELGDELLIGANMLNCDSVFLDDVTVQELEDSLGVKVRVVAIEGEALFEAIIG